MDRATAIHNLKLLLLRDVAYLCRRGDRRWISPLAQTLRVVRDENMRAVFFGGTLRSLLLSRLHGGSLGKPRDIDLVIDCASTDPLRAQFHDIVVRQTRFGGLRLERNNWLFDIWPLRQTWAFLQDGEQTPTFSALPYTTFFNLEAIAVDVWPMPGRAREIYSGDEQFFDGVLSRTVEINREDNPFPILCIARSAVMTLSSSFSVGPKLADYLVRMRRNMSEGELLEVQEGHYGSIRCSLEVLKRWLDHVEKHHAANPRSSVPPIGGIRCSEAGFEFAG